MFAIRRVITSTIKNARSKHSLPELPYGYECLEPIISRDIMMLHHQKHHNAYVTNLNAAEEKYQCAVEKCDVSGMIAQHAALRFNGGGHINHSIFWQNLSPECSKPSEQLCSALERSFGGLDNMKAALSAAAVGVQGSGWGWLAFCPNSKTLRIVSMPNQDPLQAMTGLVPLLGIDVWEHAYYLQYKNVRADYVKAIFDVVNWKDVSERYQKAMGC